MKVKVYNIKFYLIKVSCILLLFLTSYQLWAQYQLTGKVIAQRDSSVVKNCKIYINEGRQTALTDSYGQFVFHNLPEGRYTVQITDTSFRYKKTEVLIKGHNQHILIQLEERSDTLKEVVVSDQRTDFGFTHLRAVDNMGIYEGKKSEVIIPDQLVANLATNNARQVYSRVAGLNIWENDGAGLQLSIGGRGLDPNRTSNFNVRQNGYDISADALGYPESYYTPPTEAIGRIQIVRGAASLQYGTQFGGLINFSMKKPVKDKKIELLARQSAGSFGFYNAFTSASGTMGKVSYYNFFQYKRGDGWRANSHFDSYTVYANVNYALTSKTSLGVDVTQMGYLAQQPGGLSDEMFKENPQQTNRQRNWFKVNWNLFALHIHHTFSQSSEFNLRVFGLSAYRYSLGFRPNRVATIDDNSARDLIKGDFTNWGAEARYLKRYTLAGKPAVLLVGGRYYHGLNYSTQGQGSIGKGADFTYVNPEEFITYRYHFPNRNVSAFIEHIYYLHQKLSLTPGIRYEYIDTRSDGYYGSISRDLAGNVINISRTNEKRDNPRQFVLAGVGISYKPATHIDIYSNISQNYRSITFSDMRIDNPSSVIDPNMKDEKGYSIDLGIRSEQTTAYSYDVSFFYLNYNNRIGEVQFADENNRVLRRRGNIGQAVILGLESYVEGDLLHIFYPNNELWSGIIFANTALIHSTYKASEIPGVKNKQVEFVPTVNLKSGLRVGYKNIKASFQYTYLSDQFSDATNAREGGVSAVIGLIPAYTIMDISASYQIKRVKVEGTLNNFANRMYFTRRATGYPGPGILPSDGRSIYLTIQVKI
ncbi:TonB-dependent receptor domain-containing protein [Xanthocytophaga flava]|uniref:TonB-dependent receptor domain-containing protein n=1 Tax=Xanthocytophaga flava TaxID=3048013 RepID=UPI0028D51488|nr:TonB-dependent receptor [Xanthocytophaga flavus]MDJ1470335.1 TonB-dependent receptor [Xanthocytophaga flavus]